MTLTAADGTPLHGVFHPGPEGASGGVPAFVVAHGFTHHIRNPAVRRVVERLSRRGPVLAVDLRGHGRSGGRSSLGTNEVLDIDAATRHLRGMGCRRVVTVGFSLGGSVVLRQAALSPPADRPDAVVAVSSPARWWVRETSAMRRVHWLLEQPHGRWCARLLGVRLDRPWRDIPLSPIELAGRITIPTLLVHGTDDQYFSVDDAVALGEARGGESWLEPGMRHAESAMSPVLVDRIAAWSADRVWSPDRASSEAALRRPDPPGSG